MLIEIDLFETYILGVPLTNIKLFLTEIEGDCLMKLVIVVTESGNNYYFISLPKSTGDQGQVVLVRIPVAFFERRT
jgi:hypothetical protein